MAVVGLFYGSDTGNTENIAKMIQKQLGNELVDIRDIAKSSKEDIEKAFGEVKYICAEGVTGETAFLTSDMTEEKFENSAKAIEVISRIRTAGIN